MKWKLPKLDQHFRQVIQRGPMQGRYQHKIVKMALRHCSRFDLAVDVGAHVGFWSWQLAQRFRSVLAIEPQPENYGCLCDNVGRFRSDAGLGSISVLNAALGRHRGRGSLHCPDRASSGSWEMTEGDDVQVLALDDLELKELSLLKIDVQGSEADVLLGGLRTIRKHRPTIVIEMTNSTAEEDHQGELIRILKHSLGACMLERLRRDAVWVFPTGRVD